MEKKNKGFFVPISSISSSHDVHELKRKMHGHAERAEEVLCAAVVQLSLNFSID